MDRGNEEKQVGQEQQENLEDDRNLPSWMLTNQSQSETSQNNETTANSQSSPIPVHHNEGSSDAANDNGASDGINTRIACKYGAGCYRRNPAHKAEFSHPGDNDYSTTPQEDEEVIPDNDDRPECQYGTSCYRQNPQHKRDFKHTAPSSVPQADTPEQRTTRKPVKRRRPSDEDYESEGDKDYDLEDSFIDDVEDEEEANEEEEDEDYVPDYNEVDPELLKEDQWKPSADDAPEVLELLKEARDYLRNKKLQK